MRSKTSPPLLSRHAIDRARLGSRGLQPVDAKLVLIRAPAGFGKTTTLVQWLQHQQARGVTCAWLRLDDADNDASRFLSCLWASLVRATGTDRGMPDEPGGGDDGDRAVNLWERVASRASPLHLFLDDVEVLRAPAVLSLVSQLIDRAPPGMRVVLGSRGRPGIGLARWRAHGQLLEIGSAQLRFSLDETEEFLVRRRGFPLALRDIEALHRSTEGWPAGLWLASLCMERRDGRPVVDGISGADTSFADFFSEDVLRGQGDDLREFLLKTSVLDHLTPDLCNAVCDRTDSDALLAAAERANLFISPLDEQGSEYVCHRLFRDFLRARVTRDHPDWLQALHRNASNGYLAQRRIVPALHHAFASGDRVHALSLCDEQAGALLEGGRARLLTRWLDPLRGEALDAHPRLRLVHAWAVKFTRGASEALSLIEGMNAEDLLDPEARSHLLALRPMLLGMVDRIDGAHRLALQHAPMIDPAHRFAFGMVQQTLANTSMVLGMRAEARRYADTAATHRPNAGPHLQVALSQSVDGAIALMQGRLRQATARFKLATGAADPSSSGKTARFAFPGVLLAEALYDAGDENRVEPLLGAFVPLLQDIGLPDHLIVAHVLQSRIFSSRNEVEPALRAVDELEDVGRRLGLQRVLACARLERARVFIARGQFMAARDELGRAGDAGFWRDVSARHFIANDVATLPIAMARYSMRSGAADSALPKLRQLLEDADREGRMRRVLTLRLLLAEALERTGQRKAALRCLRSALEFGALEGFVRPFIEEGPSLLALVGEFVVSMQVEGEASARPGVDALLERLTGQRPGRDAHTAEPALETADGLTRQELKVLRLVAQGCSNDAIALQLFVSRSTVRTHLRSINLKLHASNRTHAVLLARRLRLLP